MSAAAATFLAAGAAIAAAILHPYATGPGARRLAFAAWIAAVGVAIVGGMASMGLILAQMFRDAG